MRHPSPEGVARAGPSLVELLATGPGPRQPRRRIHPLTAALSLAVVAILAGSKGPEAIAPFGRDRGKAPAFAPGFRRGKAPAKSTLCEIFHALDSDALEAALAAWVRGRLADLGGAIAIDGKTLEGSRDGEVPAGHLLSAFAPHGGAVLGRLRVDGKTDEHKAALRRLGVLPVAGKVVSGGTLFTHRDFARKVGDGGGDYLLFVEDNRPGLKAAIEPALHGEADFSPLPAATEGGRRAGGQDGGRGAGPARVPAADPYHAAGRLPGLAGWGAGLRAGAGARRGGQDECRGGAWHHQPGARSGRCGAALGAGAGPLGVENGLHPVRDVTPGEDDCRVRRGSVPHVLAAMRNAVVHLLGKVKAVSKAAAARRFAACPFAAIPLLLT